MILNVFFVVFSLGLLGPFLISATSDIAVGIGLAYLFLVFPAVLYYINRNYVKTMLEKIKS